MARSDPHEDNCRLADAGHLRRAEAIGVGAGAPPFRSALPARVTAIIEERPQWRTGHRKAGCKGWLLRFRTDGPYYIAPTAEALGGTDPLVHLALHFPSREAAVRYAERQGLRYEIRDPGPAGRIVGRLSSGPLPGVQPCCWPTGPHALCCGNYPVTEMEMERREKGDGNDT